MDSEQPATVVEAKSEAGLRSKDGLGCVEPEYKYLEVEITRTQGTLVFLKVPKDFRHEAIVNLKEILAAAAEETCTESDWRDESDDWQDSVEWQQIKEVPKSEAEQYKMYDVTDDSAS